MALGEWLLKEKLNGSIFGPSHYYMHMTSHVNISFDDFMPKSFWAISGTPVPS